MVKYSSTRRVESQRYPGVSFVLNKMSDARRQQLMRSLAPSKEKEREFARKFRELDAKRLPAFNADGSPKMNQETAEQTREFTDKADELEMIDLLNDLTDFKQNEVYPKYIRWGLASIDGLEIDGEAATVESLLELGPDDLVEEILKAIEGRSELTADETQNLRLQPTGYAAAGTEMNPTTAVTVNPSELSTAETAQSISQSS